jgi:molecular chaperone GrpE
MTDKKHTQPRPEDENDLPAGESLGEAEDSKVNIDSLMKRLEDAETTAAQHLDGWQRAQAEFINYKNRVARDQDAQRITMKGDIIRKLLPVLDDLERALQNRPANESWADGIELVARKFQLILESEGVKRIQAEGEAFDPKYHEAISNEPNADVESGHVIAVTQNGYMLDDKVIRPALVRVAQ